MQLVEPVHLDLAGFGEEQGGEDLTESRVVLAPARPHQRVHRLAPLLLSWDVPPPPAGRIPRSRSRSSASEPRSTSTASRSAKAAARGIEFEHSRPAGLPATIFTDQKRLRQILINLVSNAIKYTPAGSASLHVHWRNPVAEFIVQDTGVGIDPTSIDRIFEPFERLETVRGQSGVWLGLTITRMLVDITLHTARFRGRRRISVGSRGQW
ncbi:HAMP domain-containing sensor histidine kinase [Novosphingobium sp. G106]|uniref:sensor histidine kinase n=1 Tax=Novosphingobium sp. G106 TaxID=2849500 RepID=UPI0020C2843B|nr:ATP-binding protein [Novosphingobium sp. G106]